ncbi:DUF4158 domain-containing protein [Nocardiopsis gilva]|uniref:DUF4158 domain-containing protein n=1 Tax=Nocardiopsis gilva TaxID=280236 RepID=UPI000A30AFBC
MPVEFLTDEHAEAYGTFTEVPTRPELERFFFLDDDDRDLIALRRADAHRLGMAVLAGGSAGVAVPIADRAEGLDAPERGGADRCVRYLRGHEEVLVYDRAVKAGWPIATGVIEGACRHLIGDRLDITGARWGLEGAEAVLKLRAVRANGDFDAYRRYHLAREHERLYGNSGPEEYALSA